VAGFRSFLHPAIGGTDASSPSSSSDFGGLIGRRKRYRLGWSLYVNDVFWDEVSYESKEIKLQFGLYDYTRTVFNPIYRLVEFHTSHIMGGPIDPAAGDGTMVKSALPIETKSAAVRKGLSRLWRDSQWGIRKDIWVRYGAAMGDVALKGYDDPERGGITMEVIHPGSLTWVERDPYTRRITGYTREEKRHDPRQLGRRSVSPYATDAIRNPGMVDYREDAWIEDGQVHYATRLNGALYDWRLRPDGQPYGEEGEPQWTVPYGFIPLVLTQHMPVGLDWGLAEGHPVLEKVFEVADSGSNLGDHVRRILNEPAFVTGVSPDDLTLSAPAREDTTGNPQSGRTKRTLLGIPDPDAKVLFLTQGMDLAAVSGHVAALKADINEDFPELDVDLWKTGDPSGRAMRLARQRAEMKVQQRRAGYDTDLESLQRMCLAIGGIRGYDDYRGMATDDPWSDKVVAHSIAHRPVFAPDPIDDIMEGTAFWTMVKAAVDAGCPLEVVLRREGWSDEDIQEITDAQEMAQQKQMDVVQQRMALAGNAGGQPGDQTGGDGLGAPDHLFQLNGTA
jgi:hypothetical protein